MATIFYYICLFRYSQLNSLCFSLPYSGILMWRDIKRQQPSEYEVISERDSPQSHPDECQNSLTEGSNKEGEDISKLLKSSRKTK